MQDLKIDVIGINTWHHDDGDDPKYTVQYKRNLVYFISTPEQEIELRRKLKATGFVIDIEQINPQGISHVANATLNQYALTCRDSNINGRSTATNQCNEITSVLDQG